jgi:hypothetical protein
MRTTGVGSWCATQDLLKWQAGSGRTLSHPETAICEVRKTVDRSQGGMQNAVSRIEIGIIHVRRGVIWVVRIAGDFELQLPTLQSRETSQHVDVVPSSNGL